MTIVRLGFVAMSLELKNASPSQTMTFAQFQKIVDRPAAIRKLERISLSNLQNTLRILRHAAASEIYFYRMTSRLIPLASHEAVAGWDYLSPLKENLREIGDFIVEKRMRVDFHPDHFVILNAKKEEVLQQSLQTLAIHLELLQAMGLDPTHRCVLHVGGNYKATEASLERFAEHWVREVPEEIQRLIILENDDKSFTLEDTLYLCEKLSIPLVFDYHHHLAHHRDPNWTQHWERVTKTWRDSPHPIKMHISSPKSAQAFRSHADFVDVELFFQFLKEIKGSVPQIDCMIEAKKKDAALFRLMEETRGRDDVEIIDGASFRLV
ncbi:UV damage endonuclease UvsE [Ammoniphilus oxalaticus]|uniref:UV damage endonuclease UvsE n=1 Tax=Ammoniphilus oxalaticus TaxID=66863 RepID=A0A419SNR9_9BACL|nr:UV DNA damage repair endonuclease UvsE [Ammoniphilus oxalaticus]RKD25861.1 UV damage endonuclease UvsE [Ammoniphilus oxalaticus]